MSRNQRAGRAGTREYLRYGSFRAGAQVQYDYEEESTRQNTQAHREPRQTRGIAEYDTEVGRAVSRARNFGFTRNVFTGIEMPFVHLQQTRSALDLMRTLEAYARQSYSRRSVEMSYVTAFLRQLEEVKDMIGESWIGADLCANQDLSGDFAEFLHLFTGFLQGANDLYDRVQTLITRCERAMYDRRGRLRDDAKQRFMAAFIDSRERANLTGAMRGWVRSATRIDGDPDSLLSQARDLQRS